MTKYLLQLLWVYPVTTEAIPFRSVERTDTFSFKGEMKMFYKTNMMSKRKSHTRLIMLTGEILKIGDDDRKEIEIGDDDDRRQI